MKEVLRQIVKMADTGLIKKDQLEEIMEGVKVVFRSGKAETIVNGIYIVKEGRKHRFDVGEIRGIKVERGSENPATAKFKKITDFLTTFMTTAVNHNELVEDGVIRMLKELRGIKIEALEVVKNVDKSVLDSYTPETLAQIIRDFKDQMASETGNAESGSLRQTANEIQYDCECGQKDNLDPETHKDTCLVYTRWEHRRLKGVNPIDRENPAEKTISSEGEQSPTPNASASSDLRLGGDVDTSIGHVEGSGDSASGLQG